MKLSLDLLLYQQQLKTKTIEGLRYVFDPIRKSYIKLTPEELVRQCLLLYLILDRGYSKSLIQVEKQVLVLNQQRRFDIVVLDKDLNPQILVECKSYKDKIKVGAFKQSAAYNLTLKAPYTIVSNGIENYCYQVDYSTKTYEFLNEIPRLPKI